MPLPQHLLAIEDDSHFFFSAVLLIKNKAKAFVGEGFQLEPWKQVLNRLEFNLAIVGSFIGTVENCGSFVDEAFGWIDEKGELKTAMLQLGCAASVEVFDEAAEIGSLTDAETEEAGLGSRREEIEDIFEADLAYSRLAAFIKEHQAELLNQDWRLSRQARHRRAT